MWMKCFAGLILYTSVDNMVTFALEAGKAGRKAFSYLQKGCLTHSHLMHKNYNFKTIIKNAIKINKKSIMNII